MHTATNLEKSRKTPNYALFLVGALISILALFAITSAALYYSENGRERDRLSIFAQQETIDQVCFDTNAKEHYVDCAIRFLESAGKNEKDSADIKAQQDMAVWAYALLLVSIIGIIISGVGVWLIYKTLRATQDMAVQSGDATNAAIASSDATIQAVEQAKRANHISEVMAKNDRARLYVDFLKSDRLTENAGRGEYYTHVSFKIQNLGRTPAIISLAQPRLFWHPYNPFTDEDRSTPDSERHLMYEGNLDRLSEGVRMFPIPKKDRFPFKLPSNNQIVLKGGESTDELIARFYFGPNEYRTTLNALQASLHFHCIIQYQDVYNVTRKTSYFAEVSGVMAHKPPEHLDEKYNYQT